MATDAFMVFKNYSNRSPTYLASESTVALGNSNEPLAKPFSDAGAGNVFEVSDYSFNVEQTLNITSQSTGSGAGKITFNPFSITRAIDKSSPTMFLNACVGTPFQNVYLGLRKASGGSSGGLNTSGSFFLLFTFGLVAVKTISWAHADESPTETIEFGYGAMQIQYAQQKADGMLDTPIPASWNSMTNAADMPA